MNKFILVGNSPDLYGEKLLKPWKGYYSFFSKNISSDSGFNKVALIVLIASSIFGLCFGILALIGVCVKSTGIPSVNMHNTEVRKELDALGKTKPEASNNLIAPEGYSLRKIKTTLLTNLRSEYNSIVSEIEKCNREFRNVYLQKEMLENKFFTVSICVLDPINNL